MTAGETPAGRLRRAADLLEHTAAAANPGPWQPEYAYGNPRRCHGLATGHTADELISDAEQRYAIPATDAEYLVAAAVRARRPEHAGQR